MLRGGFTQDRAGVVDEDVNPPVFKFYRFDERVERLSIAEIARVAGEDPPELFTACSVLRPGASVAAVSRSSKKAKQTAVPLGS